MGKNSINPTTRFSSNSLDEWVLTVYRSGRPVHKTLAQVVNEIDDWLNDREILPEQDRLAYTNAVYLAKENNQSARDCYQRLLSTHELTPTSIYLVSGLVFLTALSNSAFDVNQSLSLFKANASTALYWGLSASLLIRHIPALHGDIFFVFQQSQFNKQHDSLKNPPNTTYDKFKRVFNQIAQLLWQKQWRYFLLLALPSLAEFFIYYYNMNSMHKIEEYEKNLPNHLMRALAAICAIANGLTYLMNRSYIFRTHFRLGTSNILNFKNLARNLLLLASSAIMGAIAYNGAAAFVHDKIQETYDNRSRSIASIFAAFYFLIDLCCTSYDFTTAKKFQASRSSNQPHNSLCKKILNFLVKNLIFLLFLLINTLVITSNIVEFYQFWIDSDNNLDTKEHVPTMVYIIATLPSFAKGAFQAYIEQANFYAHIDSKPFRARKKNIDRYALITASLITFLATSIPHIFIEFSAPTRKLWPEILKCSIPASISVYMKYLHSNIYRSNTNNNLLCQALHFTIVLLFNAGVEQLLHRTLNQKDNYHDKDYHYSSSFSTVLTSVLAANITLLSLLNIKLPKCSLTRCYQRLFCSQKKYPPPKQGETYAFVNPLTLTSNYGSSET